MSETSWYEVVEGDGLLQGDLLRDCPVTAVSGLERWPLEHADELSVEITLEDLLILSQSCDLVNEKIDQVLLAQVIPPLDAGSFETEGSVGL